MTNREFAPRLRSLAREAFFIAACCWVTAAQGVVFTSQLVTNLAGVSGMASDSAPSAGAAMGGYFYFAATDGPNGAAGRELWRTDGTPGGTALFMDIFQGAADSSPYNIVAAGTNIFFVATDGVHGQQLWRSDGTVNGTIPITTFTPDVFVAEIIPMGNGACFVIDHGFFTASVLYRTDGTAAGTFPLNGPGGSVTSNDIGGFGVSGTDIAIITLDFSTTFSFNTNSIWRFGGTGPYFTYRITTQPRVIGSVSLVGTNCYFVTGSNYMTIGDGFTNYYALQILSRTSTQVTDGAVQRVDSTPPDAFSQFDGMTLVNGRLFYSYQYTDDPEDDIFDYGPWNSVGQSGSPVSILPSGSGSQPILGFIGSLFYYWDGATTISRTDGTSAGVPVLNLGPLGYTPDEFQQVGSKFFFTGGTPHSFSGLAVTDLTSAGTHEMTNAVTDTNGYVLGFLGALGSVAIYHATSDQIGDEPYRSDGTTINTYLLKDIAVASSSQPPFDAVAVGGQFFFSLTNAAFGTELWHSDGTAAGTTLVKDIRGGTNSSSPSQMTAWNGLLYFSANNGTNGAELWRSDGTAAGTYMVKDIRVGLAGSNPTQLTPAGNQLFFVADDGAHGPELWVTDGTSNGTVMAQDIQPGISSGNIRGIVATGNEVHFLAGPTNTSGQLWVSTGQPGGTQFLEDFGTVGDSSTWPRDFTLFNGEIYFVIVSEFFGTTYATLFQTDDTPEGTVEVGQGGSDLSTANGVLFANFGTSLYVSDGTANGTIIVTNLPNNIASLTPLGSLMYFTSGSQLWASDGTTNGTVPVGQFSPANPNLVNLTPFQGALVFNATTPLLGQELWATALEQVPGMVEDLSPFSGNDNIQFISAATNQIFYVAKPSGQPSWQIRSLHLQTLGSPPHTAYGGVPWPVPGLIQAENFDLGGDGVGYHDTTADNEGAQYRLLDGVDLETCNDTNGGYCVYQTRPGEWMDYTINAAYAGIYELDIRMTSSAEDTGAYHFEVDGTVVDTEGVFNSGTAGGWTTIVTEIPVNSGVHVLRIVFDDATSAGDVGVFNWFNFSLVETNAPPMVSISFPPAGGIVATNTPVTLQAQVVDGTTWTAPILQFFIDGQSVGITNSPHGVAWTPTPGTHTVYATAIDSFGASGVSSNVVFYVAQPYLPERSLWRANFFGTNLPNAWRGLTYDDSQWPRLRAPLGFGYPTLQTVIFSNFNSAPIPTFYFRQTFTNNLGSFTAASVTLTRDDGAVIWINGQQLARLNMGEGKTIVFTNLAATNVNNSVTQTNAAQDVVGVPPGMLVAGTNVIAVEVHQGVAVVREIFDLKFDLSLSTFTAAMLTITDATNSVLVQWPDSLAGWNLEHSTDLKAWNTVTGTPSDTNGLFNLLLTPPLGQQDFFRLHQVPGP